MPDMASAAPARAPTPGVDVHVRSVHPTADVESQPAYQIREIAFNPVHNQSEFATVSQGETPVAVHIHRYVGSVAVLMSAVARGTSHRAVVRRRPESRVDVDQQAIGAGWPPLADGSKNKLELVQQARAQRDIPWPLPLIVVRHEVAQSQVSRELKIEQFRVHSHESLRTMPASESLAQVRADPVRADRAVLLGLERHHHADSNLVEHTCRSPTGQRQPVESRFYWSDNPGASQRPAAVHGSMPGQAHPVIRHVCRVTFDFQRIIHGTARHREANVYAATTSECIARGLRSRRNTRDQSLERSRATEGLSNTQCCYRRNDSRDHGKDRWRVATGRTCGQNRGSPPAIAHHFEVQDRPQRAR